MPPRGWRLFDRGRLRSLFLDSFPAADGVVVATPVYGGFPFVGARACAVQISIIEVRLGCTGLGGLLYALTVRQLFRAPWRARPGAGRPYHRHLSPFVVALGSMPVMAPAIALLGLGIHMLHNMLQASATQMAPGVRGVAVSTYAKVLFLGEAAAGVWLCGVLVGSASRRSSWRSASRSRSWAPCSRRCSTLAPPRTEPVEASP